MSFVFIEPLYYLWKITISTVKNWNYAHKLDVNIFGFSRQKE